MPKVYQSISKYPPLNQLSGPGHYSGLDRLYMVLKYEGYDISADCSVILLSAEILGVVPSSYKKENVTTEKPF